MIGNLLGYEYIDGDINRSVIFYQDRDQQIETERKKEKIKIEDWEWCSNNEEKYRRKLVLQLKNDGLTNFKISKIMGISLYGVKKYLQRKK